MEHRSGAFAKVLRRVLEVHSNKACAEQKLRKSFCIRCWAAQAMKVKKSQKAESAEKIESLS